MAKFRIVTSDLIKLLNLIAGEYKTTTGDTRRFVNDLLLKCGDGKVSIQAITPNQEAFISIKFVAEILEEGSIPLGSVDEFLKYLSRFGKNDSVVVSSTEENVLIERLNPKKTAYIPLIDEKNIQSMEGLDQMLSLVKIDQSKITIGSGTVLDSIAKFKAEDMAEIIEDGEQVGQHQYPILLSPDRMKVLVGSKREGGIETIIPTSKIIASKEVKSTFVIGQHIFKNLSGEVKMYIADNCPLFISQRNKIMEFEAILCPYVDTGEEANGGDKRLEEAG